MAANPRRRGALQMTVAWLLAAPAFAGGRLAAQEPAATAPGASVPVSVLAVAFPIAGASDAQVPLLVEVDGPALLAGNSGRDLAGEIRAVAIGTSGQTGEEIVQPFVLDPTDPTLLQTGLKLFAMMRLAPGDYRLRVEANNAATGAAGSWEGSLHVPDFAGGEAALSPPLFPESADRWRVFRQSESPHEGLPYPFAGAGGESFLPAASPLVGSDGGPFHLYVYGAAAAPKVFEGRLIGPDGRSSKAPIELLGVADGPGGARRVALALGAPLPPAGAYRLEVALGGSQGSSRTPLRLLGEPLQAAEPLAVVVVQPAAVEEEAVLPVRWSRSALGQRYRELLVRGAELGLETVAAELAATELSATADHKAGQVRALREVQEEVLRQVEAAGGDGLLPVIYLHFLADRELVRRRETWMIAQNRHWVSTLVQRWVGGSSDTAARRLGAQLLAALGVSPVALELDPGNELALLRQAATAEKSGGYRHALAWIEQLLAAHPESHHARLRQAVLYRRLGDGERAIKHLAAFVEQPAAPRWMIVLAYQELAEAHRERGNARAAEAVLRQGIERHEAQELYLQLAFYLDSWQRPDDAVSALNRMPVLGEESSARHVYNAPPNAEVEAAQRQFEASLPPALPQLQVALGGATGTGEVQTR